MKARSFECMASQSFARLDDVQSKLKREAWVNDGHLIVMQDQLNQLSEPQRRALSQIGTALYGNQTMKGQA